LRWGCFRLLPRVDVLNQFAQPEAMLVFEPRVRNQIRRLITNIVHATEAGDQFGPRTWRKNGVLRGSDQNQHRLRVTLQGREPFRDRRSQRIEMTADDRRSLLGDAGGLSRIDNFRSSVQLSISTRFRLRHDINPQQTRSRAHAARHAQ
jgi:hypothetical protein